MGFPMSEVLAAAPPEAGLDGTLDEVRARIDSVLRSMPESTAEARLTVTRELEIDPRPEELQAIFRIAHEPADDPALRELARTALALRVLAERSVRELFDSPNLSAAGIGRSTLLVSGLLGTADKLETEVQSRIERIGSPQQDYLLEVVDALLPSAEPLIAGMSIAPRLLALVDAAERGDARAAVPGLSEADAALLRTAVSPAKREPEGVGRLAVNAIALRSVIEDDLASWRHLAGADDPESATRRQMLLDRLKRARTAYRYVARRLQQRQDTALRAGLQPFAEQLRRVQRDLFSTYLKLAPLLNRPGEADKPDTGPAESETAADLDRLLRACSLSEKIADAERESHVSNEQLYVSALERMGDGGTRHVRTRERSPRSLAAERRRFKTLAATAIVLLVACVALYAHRLTRERIDLNVAPDDLGVSLELIGATSLGPMLHAQVSHWTWDDLSEADRRKGVEQLGIAAQKRGHVTVYLADENERQLAIWTQLGGAKLTPSKPAPAD